MNSFTISTNPSGPARTARNRAKRQRRRARRRQQVTPAASTSVTVTTGRSVNQPGPSRRRRGRGRRGLGSGLQPMTRFYLDTLMDPCGPPGAKIPDSTSVKTGTARLVWRFITQIPDGGAAFLATPYVYNGIATYLGANTPERVTFPGADAFRAAFDKYRPVSMCMDMEFVGNSDNNGGYYYLGRGPSGFTPSSQDHDALSNIPENVLLPVRAGRAVRVTWTPEDNSDFEFINSEDGSGPIKERRGAVDGFETLHWAYPMLWQEHNTETSVTGPLRLGADWWETLGGHSFPVIYGGVRGNTGNQSMIVQVTLNVETITRPTLESFVTSSPSPSDPIGMGKVSSIVEALPAVATVAGIGGGVAAMAAKQFGGGYGNVMPSERAYRDLQMGSYSVGGYV